MTQKIQEFKTRLEKMLALALAGAIDLSTVDGASTCLSESILIYVYKQALTDINNNRLNIVNEKLGYYNKRSIESQFVLDDVERSYAVICKEDGNYSLIVEVKSKLPNNQKRIIDIKHGGSKNLKGAYRIDSEIIPLVALTTSIDKKHPKLEQVIKFREEEEKYNNILATIHPKYFIHMYTIIEDRAKFIKYHTYMDCKDFDLKQLLIMENEEILLQKFPNLKNITIEKDNIAISLWKLDVFNKILNAVNIIHAQQICHGDLKPENILCNFNNDTGLFDVWIIDFGNAEKFGHKEVPLGATIDYRSPEFWIHCAVRNINKTKQATLYDIQQLLYNQKQSNLGLVKARKLIMDQNFNPNDYTEYSVGCGEYDIWSLGIIFLEIFKLNIDDIPSFGDGFFTLVHDLLSVDPKKRPSTIVAMQKINPTIEYITNYSDTSASKKINLGANTPKNSTHMLNAINNMQNCALLFSCKLTKDKDPFEIVTNELRQYLTIPFALLSNDDYLNQINNFFNVMKNYINSFLVNVENIKQNTNYLHRIQGAIQESIKALQSDASANNCAISSSHGANNNVRIDPDSWMSKKIIIDLLEFLNKACLMLEAALTENKEQIISIHETMLNAHLKNAKLAESNRRMSFNKKFGL